MNTILLTNLKIVQSNLKIVQLLSDPTYEPPEEVLSLNLSGNFKDVLDQIHPKICAAFAVGEAKLVLPIYKAEFPDDHRFQEAVATMEKWLENNMPTNIESIIGMAAGLIASITTINSNNIAWYAAFAVYDAMEVAYHVCSISHRKYISLMASHVAVNASRAGLNERDQLVRLFNLLGNSEIK